jgi:hypothetical protein
MSIDPFIEHPEPDPGEHHVPDLKAQACAALEHWLEDHPEVAGEIKETVRAHVYLKELEHRADQAEHAKQVAEQRDATMLTRHDPGDHRVLGFGLGAILVVLLVVLDTIPLNWSAQAFGLDSGGTWLVTLILVIASVGAMLGFELTRRHRRRRGLLAAVVTLGYVALFGLRTEFLITVAGESLLVALLQSAMLTAISAGLVLCGSVILGRTRSPRLSRSRAAVRRTQQAATEARAAQADAAEMLQRHVGGLWQLQLPWALRSAAPAGVDRAEWAAALKRAIRQLFPAP